MAARHASLAIFLFGGEALLLQVRDQPRMRFHIKLETATLHPHCRRDGAHLDFVGCPLHIEAGQELLSEPPRDDCVDRGVFNLLPG